MYEVIVSTIRECRKAVLEGEDLATAEERIDDAFDHIVDTVLMEFE